MRLFRRVSMRLRLRLGKSEFDREMDEELRLHIELETECNLRAGMSPTEARRKALLSFGGVERFREQTRDARGGRLLDDVLRDLRFGFRTLRKRPAFTVATVATLSLGIGISTSMFTVVDAVLLRPLSFKEPDQLVSVWQARPSYQELEIRSGTWDKYALSYPQYERWREGADLFQGVAVHGMRERVLGGVGNPEKLEVGIASASLLPVLGVMPALGRWFVPGEDGPGARRLAVLSDGIWMDRFGADTLVLGRTVRLDGEPYQVIGVLPRGFNLRRAATRGETDMGDRGLWIPVGAGGMDLSGDQSYLEGIGRLAPGVSVAQARGEAGVLLDDDVGGLVVETRVAALEEVENRDSRGPLFLFLGATGLLVLIACGNVALLLTAEATGRRHEMGTRAALGASRHRIVRQLLVEGTSLGLLGGLGGMLLAFGGTAALVALAPPMPRLENIAPDMRALLFSGGLGVLCGCVFGLGPLAVIWKGELGAAMRERLATSPAGNRGFQEGIVALEIAFTLVLAAFGGLLFRSYTRLVDVDPGFEARNLVVAQIAFPADRFDAPEERVEIIARLRASLERIPGASDVSLARRLPLVDRPSGNIFTVEGRSLPPGERWPMAFWNAVDPGFHETLGIPLISGRAISATDGPDAPGVMVVSEAMARAVWPDRTPIGERVLWSDRWWRVVGVVGNVRHGSLVGVAEPSFYVPISQDPPEEMSLVLRAAGDPSSVIGLVPEALWGVDPDIPVEYSEKMTSRIRDSVREERFRTFLMVVFASAASILALVGVFGVTARAAGQRTRELGVRLALGATRNGLVAQVAFSSCRMVALGGLLGLAAFLPASSLLARHLFQVRPTDPLVLALVVTSLAVTAVSASFLAALRAASVHPTEMLRAE